MHHAQLDTVELLECMQGEGPAAQPGRCFSHKPGHTLFKLEGSDTLRMQELGNRQDNQSSIRECAASA